MVLDVRFGGHHADHGQEQSDPGDVTRRERRLLLDDWHRKLRRAASQHAQWRDYVSRRGQRIGAPAALLTVIVSTSLFASLNGEPHVAAKVAVLVISMSATLLSGLQAYLKDADSAVRYQKYWHEYSELARDLECLKAELTAAEPNTRDVRRRRQELTRRWNAIDEQAPGAPAGWRERRRPRRTFSGRR